MTDRESSKAMDKREERRTGRRCLEGSGVIAKPVPIPFPTLSHDRVILVITITSTNLITT